jgi:hypothetical protein
MDYDRECPTKNWRKSGYDQALAGDKPSSEDMNQCAARGISVKRTDYQEGYVDGIQQFCTFDYGLSFGREGHEYNDTCPPSVMNAFLAGYSQGKMEYQSLKVAREKEDARKVTEEAIRDSKSRSARPSSMSSLDRNKACHFDSDCRTNGSCSSTREPGIVHRCDGSGELCHSDSDCKYQGDCSHSICKWN